MLNCWSRTATCTFSAQRLFESVWQEPYYYGANNNTVTVHIRNLRSKVEDNPGNPELIKQSGEKGIVANNNFHSVTMR